MKTRLNFFDRLMMAVTFAEAGVESADCTRATKPAVKDGSRKANHLSQAAKAQG